jgi:hypothetical protein
VNKVIEIFLFLSAYGAGKRYIKNQTALSAPHVAQKICMFIFIDQVGHDQDEIELPAFTTTGRAVLDHKCETLRITQQSCAELDFLHSTIGANIDKLQVIYDLKIL